jgi:hypothetical protein
VLGVGRFGSPEILDAGAELSFELGPALEARRGAVFPARYGGLGGDELGFSMSVAVEGEAVDHECVAEEV